jgi:hypothetical protein
VIATRSDSSSVDFHTPYRGPNSFKLVEKSKGKAIVIIHYHLAADGKGMTAKGTNGQGKEPFTQVYEKQS